MGEPLENLYFNWLCAKVIDPWDKHPPATYWTLMKILHTTEFVWLVTGDDSRSQDGKELRREFLLLGEIPDDPDWRTIYEASILEVLIAFSRRAEFMTDQSAVKWFWEFLENLGLTDCDDNHIEPQDVLEVVDIFIWRKYDPDGHGGLFPLRENRVDQREIEILYQFAAYLTDQDRNL